MFEIFGHLASTLCPGRRRFRPQVLGHHIHAPLPYGQVPPLTKCFVMLVRQGNVLCFSGLLCLFYLFCRPQININNTLFKPVKLEPCRIKQIYKSTNMFLAQFQSCQPIQPKDVNPRFKDTYHLSSYFLTGM